MKFKNRLTAFIVVLAAACLILPAPVSALVLSLETEDASGATETVFLPGEEIRVLILIDDPTEVAGAAFTLEYDPDVVIPPTTVDGVADPTGDVSGAAFPFTFVKDEVTTITHRENSEMEAAAYTGKLYLSGAAIDEADGGPKPVAATETVLFYIKFTVKAGVAAGTAFSFGLSQTELMNVAAGYGTDVDGDGIYEPGDGDLKTMVPVLVGAVDNTHEDWADLSSAFPVLLSDTTDPAFVSPTPADSTVGDPETLDRDEDNMPDSWEQQIVDANLGDTITNYREVLPDDDFDGDGASNIKEYEKGTDPTDPNSRPIMAMPWIPLLLLD